MLISCLQDISRAPCGPARRSLSRGDYGRDNDYYADRRSPSPRRGRSYYDRDYPDDDPYERSRGRQRSQTPDHDERSPSQGPPSKEVMIEGLAPHLTEKDVRLSFAPIPKADGP
jgi:hypothetical protein